MNQQNPNIPNNPQQNQQQQQQLQQQQQQNLQNNPQLGGGLNLQNLQQNDVPNANWRDELNVQDRARFVSQL